MAKENTEKHTAGQLSRREMVLLMSVVGLALVLRFAYHFEMRGNDLVEQLQLDELFHDRWAQSIAAGNVTGEGVFFRAPLYPYAVAAVYAVSGNSPGAVRVLQHLLGAGTVLLIYILCRFLFGIRSAMAAALLGAAYPVLIVFEGRLLFDFPLSFLVLLWVTLVVLLAGRQSWGQYALFGFLYGLICIMRPTFLALAVPLFGYVVWAYLRASRNLMRCTLALAIAFVIPVLAVTVRNALVGGDPVVVASQGGINFYIGNNPRADGYSSSVPEAGGLRWRNRDVEHITERAIGHPPSQSEVSRYWYGRGWVFIRGEPWAFLQLLVRKFLLFWSYIEIANNLSYYWFARASSVLSMLPVGFWLVGPLGIGGAILAWKEPRSRILLLFLALYCIVTIAFFVTDRFRLPIVPVLCVFAGYALHYIWACVTASQWRTTARALAFAGIGVLLVDSDFGLIRTDTGHGEEQGMLGRVALDSGDFEKAVELLEHVVVVNPGNYVARINLGAALWGVGRTREAADAFRAGIPGDPYLAFLNLARLYSTLQLLDSARIYAERAIEARPFAPGGYIIAAKVSMLEQNIGSAQEILQRGDAMCGEDFVYGDYLLAGLYFQTGNFERADSMYRKVGAFMLRSRQPAFSIESEKAQYGEDVSTLYPKSLHALGRVFAARQQFDSSEAYLRSAAHLLPTNAEMWGDWGVCLMRLHRLDEADTVMSRALSNDSNNPVIWLNFATLRALRGQLDDARKAVSSALALKPDFAEAQRLMEVLKKK